MLRGEKYVLNDKKYSSYLAIGALFIPCSYNSIYRRILRAISIIVCVLFAWQQVTWAQGQPIIPAITSPKIDLSIPQDKAITKEVVSFDSDEIIINIQDAHDSLSAQYSIVDILDTLVKDYNISLIALEGSSGYIDTSLIKTFPIEEIRESTADYLMKEGELSAGEFFSIISDADIEVYGIEDNILYKEHVESFRINIDKKKENITRVDSFLNCLTKIEDAVYPVQIKKLNEKSSLYKKGDITFKEYWEAVNTTAGGVKETPSRGLDSARNEPRRPEIASSADLKSGPPRHVRHFMSNVPRNDSEYPNLKKFAESIEIEKDIDFDKANRERRILVHELKDLLPREDLNHLVLKSLQYKLKKISAREFHTFLLGIAKDTVVSEKKNGKYSNLISYTEYMNIYESIDIVSLFSELERFEDEKRSALFTDDDQRALYEIKREALMLKDIFSISLAADKLEYFLDNIERFDPYRYISFAKRMYKELSLPEQEISDLRRSLKELFLSMDEAIHFYNLALQRDRAIINNTLKKMRRDNRKVAALVTGGFHTKGMTKILKDKNTSYIVLIPKFDKDAPKRPYVAVLTKRKAPYAEELLDSGKYQLATYSHFVKNGIFDDKAADIWADKVIDIVITQGKNKGYSKETIIENLNIWVEAYAIVQDMLDKEGRLDKAKRIIAPKELAKKIEKKKAGLFAASAAKKGRYFERQRRAGELKKDAERSELVRPTLTGGIDEDLRERAVSEYNSVQDRRRPNGRLWFRAKQRGNLIFYLMHLHGVLGSGDEGRQMSREVHRYNMRFGDENRPLMLSDVVLNPASVVAIQRYELSRLESGRQSPQETQMRLNILRGLWNEKPWERGLSVDEIAVDALSEDADEVLRFGSIQFPVKKRTGKGAGSTETIELRVLSRGAQYLRFEIENDIDELEKVKKIALPEFKKRLRLIEETMDDIGVRGLTKFDGIDALHTKQAEILEKGSRQAEALWNEIKENVSNNRYQDVEALDNDLARLDEIMRILGRKQVNAEKQRADLRSQVEETIREENERKKEAVLAKIEEFYGAVAELDKFAGERHRTLQELSPTQEDESRFQTAVKAKRHGLQQQALARLTDKRNEILQLDDLIALHAGVGELFAELQAAQITPRRSLLERLGNRAETLIDSAINGECAAIDGLGSLTELKSAVVPLKKRIAELRSITGGLKGLLGDALPIEPDDIARRISLRFAQKKRETAKKTQGHKDDTTKKDKIREEKVRRAREAGIAGRIIEGLSNGQIDELVENIETAKARFRELKDFCRSDSDVTLEEFNQTLVEFSQARRKARELGVELPLAKDKKTAKNIRDEIYERKSELAVTEADKEHEIREYLAPLESAYEDIHSTLNPGQGKEELPWFLKFLDADHQGEDEPPHFLIKSLKDDSLIREGGSGYELLPVVDGIDGVKSALQRASFSRADDIARVIAALEQLVGRAGQVASILEGVTEAETLHDQLLHLIRLADDKKEGLVKRLTEAMEESGEIERPRPGEKRPVVIDVETLEALREEQEAQEIQERLYRKMLPLFRRVAGVLAVSVLIIVLVVTSRAYSFAKLPVLGRFFSPAAATVVVDDGAKEVEKERGAAVGDEKNRSFAIPEPDYLPEDFVAPLNKPYIDSQLKISRARANEIEKWKKFRARYWMNGGRDRHGNPWLWAEIPAFARDGNDFPVETEIVVYPKIGHHLSAVLTDIKTGVRETVPLVSAVSDMSQTGRLRYYNGRFHPPEGKRFRYLHLNYGYDASGKPLLQRTDGGVLLDLTGREITAVPRLSTSELPVYWWRGARLDRDGNVVRDREGRPVLGGVYRVHPGHEVPGLEPYIPISPGSPIGNPVIPGVVPSQRAQEKAERDLRIAQNRPTLLISMQRNGDDPDNPLFAFRTDDELNIDRGRSFSKSSELPDIGNRPGNMMFYGLDSGRLLRGEDPFIAYNPEDDPDREHSKVVILENDERGGVRGGDSIHFSVRPNPEKEKAKVDERLARTRTLGAVATSLTHEALEHLIERFPIHPLFYIVEYQHPVTGELIYENANWTNMPKEMITAYLNNRQTPIQMGGMTYYGLDHNDFNEKWESWLNQQLSRLNLELPYAVRVDEDGEVVRDGENRPEVITQEEVRRNPNLAFAAGELYRRNNDGSYLVRIVPGFKAGKDGVVKKVLNTFAEAQEEIVKPKRVYYLSRRGSASVRMRISDADGGWLGLFMTLWNNPDLEVNKIWDDEDKCWIEIGTLTLMVNYFRDYMVMKGRLAAIGNSTSPRAFLPRVIAIAPQNVQVLPRTANAFEADRVIREHRANWVAYINNLRMQYVQAANDVQRGNILKKGLRAVNGSLYIAGNTMYVMDGFPSQHPAIPESLPYQFSMRNTQNLRSLLLGMRHQVLNHTGGIILIRHGGLDQRIRIMIELLKEVDKEFPIYKPLMNRIKSVAKRRNNLLEGMWKRSEEVVTMAPYGNADDEHAGYIRILQNRIKVLKRQHDVDSFIELKILRRELELAREDFSYVRNDGKVDFLVYAVPPLDVARQDRIEEDDENQRNFDRLNDLLSMIDPNQNGEGGWTSGVPGDPNTTQTGIGADEKKKAEAEHRRFSERLLGDPVGLVRELFNDEDAWAGLTVDQIEARKLYIWRFVLDNNLYVKRDRNTGRLIIVTIESTVDDAKRVRDRANQELATARAMTPAAEAPGEPVASRVMNGAYVVVDPNKPEEAGRVVTDPGKVRQEKEALYNERKDLRKRYNSLSLDERAGEEGRDLARQIGENGDGKRVVEDLLHIYIPGYRDAILHLQKLLAERETQSPWERAYEYYDSNGQPTGEADVYRVNRDGETTDLIRSYRWPGDRPDVSYYKEPDTGKEHLVITVMVLDHIERTRRYDTIVTDMDAEVNIDGRTLQISIDVVVGSRDGDQPSGDDSGPALYNTKGTRRGLDVRWVNINRRTEPVISPYYISEDGTRDYGVHPLRVVRADRAYEITEMSGRKVIFEELKHNEDKLKKGQVMGYLYEMDGRGTRDSPYTIGRRIGHSRFSGRWLELDGASSPIPVVEHYDVPERPGRSIPVEVSAVSVVDGKKIKYVVYSNTVERVVKTARDDPKPMDIVSFVHERKDPADDVITLGELKHVGVVLEGVPKALAQEGIDYFVGIYRLEDIDELIRKDTVRKVPPLLPVKEIDSLGRVLVEREFERGLSVNDEYRVTMRRYAKGSLLPLAERTSVVHRDGSYHVEWDVFYDPPRAVGAFTERVRHGLSIAELFRRFLRTTGPQDEDGRMLRDEYYDITEETGLMRARRFGYHYEVKIKDDERNSYEKFMPKEGATDIPEDYRRNASRSTDYYKPMDRLGRAIMTEIDGSVIFTDKWTDDGDELHSFRGNRYGDIQFEYATVDLSGRPIDDPEKGRPTLVEVWSKYLVENGLQHDEKIKAALAGMHNVLRISDDARLDVVKEIPWIAVTDEKGITRYMPPDDEQGNTSLLIMIPNDPLGRDIFRILSPGDTDPDWHPVLINKWYDEGKTITLNSNGKTRKVTVPFGVSPGNIMIYKEQGIFRMQESYYSGSVMVGVVEKRLNGKMIRYFTEDILPGDRTEIAYKYEVKKGDLLASVLYSKEGTLAISRQGAVLARLTNAYASNARVIPVFSDEPSGIVTEGREYIIYDLNSPYLRPLVSVNENRQIQHIFLKDVYAKTTDEEGRQAQETKFIALKGDPFTLSTHERTAERVRRDIEIVVGEIQEAEETDFRPIASRLKSNRELNLQGKYTLQEYIYVNGIFVHQGRLDVLDNARKESRWFVIMIGAFFGIFIIAARLVRSYMNNRRRMRESEKRLSPPRVSKFNIEAARGARGVAPFSVTEPIGNWEQILSDAADSFAPHAGSPMRANGLMQTTVNNLRKYIAGLLDNGLSWKLIIDIELFEFDEWRSAHGETGETAYTLEHILLKELSYSCAVKLKSSTATFVPYLLDYGLRLMEKGMAPDKIAERILREEAIWFDFIKKWSDEDDKRLKGTIITIENMDRLFGHDGFLQDYREARDLGEEKQMDFLASLTKKRMRGGFGEYWPDEYRQRTEDKGLTPIVITESYGIYHDPQGGFYNIKGELPFLQSHKYLFAGLLGICLLVMGLYTIFFFSLLPVILSFFSIPTTIFSGGAILIQNVPVFISHWIFTGPGLALTVPVLLFSRGKFFTDVIKAWRGDGSPGAGTVRNNMKMALLFVSITIVLWSAWNYFMILYLVTPLLHVMSGKVVAEFGLAFALIASALMVYIPTFHFSKPGNGSVSRKLDSVFGAVPAKPYKEFGKWLRLTAAREVLEAFIKGLPFFIGQVVLMLCLPQVAFVTLFLLPFAFFFPLSYFSAYYQTQAQFGYIYGAGLGLGTHTTLRDFSGKLSDAKERFLAKAPFGEEGWQIIWEGTIDNVYFEDKIDRETWLALKAGDVGALGDNEEAEERILYFLSSLYMDIPVVPGWDDIPTESMVFTSAGEPMVFLLDRSAAGSLNTRQNTGYTELTYLVKQHHPEWLLFLKRLRDTFPDNDEVARFTRDVEKLSGRDMILVEGDNIRVLREGEEEALGEGTVYHNIANLVDHTPESREAQANNYDMKFSEIIEHWANMRFTGLYRSMYGLVHTRHAYELYARACGKDPAEIGELVDKKLQLVLNMQTYKNSPDDLQERGIRRVMQLQPFLEINYIKPSDDRSTMISVLAKIDENNPVPTLRDVDQIVWPSYGFKEGDMRIHRVSKWKCENQDNFTPFLWGEFIFFADATSDARVEDGVKLIHSLMEFREDPGIKLIVFREYLFTDVNNWTAHCIAFADRTWSSISQRNLNALGSEGFYGHSGLMPRKTVHEYAALQVDYVSEDIALPMRFWAMGKGYKSKHIEYTQFGKARDVSFHGPAAAHFKYPAGSLEMWTGPLGQEFMGSRNVYWWQKFVTAMTFGFLNRKALNFITIVEYPLIVLLIGLSFNINMPVPILLGIAAMYISQLITIPGIMQEILEKPIIRALLNFFGVIIPAVAGIGTLVVFTSGALLAFGLVILGAITVITSVHLFRRYGFTKGMAKIIGLFPQLIVIFPAYIPVYAAGHIEGARGKASFIRTVRGWRLNRLGVLTNPDLREGFWKQILISWVLLAVIGFGVMLWWSVQIWFSSFFIITILLWGLTPFITDMVGREYMPYAIAGYGITSLGALLAFIFLVPLGPFYLTPTVIMVYLLSFSVSPDVAYRIWNGDPDKISGHISSRRYRSLARRFRIEIRKVRRLEENGDPAADARAGQLRRDMWHALTAREQDVLRGSAGEDLVGVMDRMRDRLIEIGEGVQKREAGRVPSRARRHPNKEEEYESRFNYAQRLYKRARNMVTQKRWTDDPDELERDLWPAVEILTQALKILDEALRIQPNSKAWQLRKDIAKLLNALLDHTEKVSGPARDILLERLWMADPDDRESLRRLEEMGKKISDISRVLTKASYLIIATLSLSMVGCSAPGVPQDGQESAVMVIIAIIVGVISKIAFSIYRKKSLARPPTLLLGIQKGRDIDLRSLRMRLGDISIEIVDIPKGEKEPHELMERALRNRKARLAILLDEGVTDIDEIGDQIAPFVQQLKLEDEKRDIETLSERSKRVARVVSMIRRGEDAPSILDIISKFNTRERGFVLDLAQKALSPAVRVDWDRELHKAREVLKGRTPKTPKTAVITTGVLEDFPKAVTNLKDELASNREDNILVITDARVTDETKDEYLKMLNDSLKEHFNIELETFFKDENIVTFDKLQEELPPGKERVTKEDAYNAAKAMVEKIKSTSHVDIVLVGGASFLRGEIDFAMLIKGIFNGDERAIETALRLLGEDAKDLRRETLRRQVIDLRGYTKDLQIYRRAIRETKRAL